MTRTSLIERPLLLLALLLGLVVAAGAATTTAAEAASADTIRVGYFPNITHSQALVGLAQGTFQKHLGKNVKIETKVFNAGPSEIEALFAGAIDLGYIGPNPAINGYIKSKGSALRVIAGATSGGAVFVVRKDVKIGKPGDLAGKKLASPQLGNTQDVALRNYVRVNKIKNVTIQPIQNPDILTLFVKKQLHGAWVPEPWGARLVKDGGGRVFLDERSLWPDRRFVTAHVIVSTKFLKEHPDLVLAWLRGHVEATQWIRQNRPDAISIVNHEIKKITGKKLADEVINQGFSRLEVTWDPVKSSLFKSADDAFKLGFIKSKDVRNIYDLKLLNKALQEKELSPIS